jgi:hypothetical protein
MSITVKEIMGPAEGSLVRNIILFSVLIYELVGPMLTKIALTKAGDIVSKEEYHRQSMAEAFADEPDEEDAVQQAQSTSDR